MFSLSQFDVALCLLLSNPYQTTRSESILGDMTQYSGSRAPYKGSVGHGQSMAKHGEAFAHGCLNRVRTTNNWLVSKVWPLTQQSKFRDFRVSLCQSCSSHDATVSPLDLATWPSTLSNLRTPYPNVPDPRCTEGNKKWHSSQPAVEILQAGHCASHMLHSWHGENDCLISTDLAGHILKSDLSDCADSLSGSIMLCHLPVTTGSLTRPTSTILASCQLTGTAPFLNESMHLRVRSICNWCKFDLAEASELSVAPILR